MINTTKRIAATIGTFDGVHKGHQFLLQQLKDVAKEYHFEPKAITFDIPPITVIQPEKRFYQLSGCQEKKALIKAFLDTDPIVLKFDRAMANITSADFIKLLHEKWAVNLLLIGYDHRFGKGIGEDFDYYKKVGAEMGVMVLHAKELLEADIRYSSSRIRQALAEGDIHTANQLLGRMYRMEGTVKNGFKIGRILGYPTANLEISPNKLIPKDGVYAVRIHFEHRSMKGMLYIGNRPTLGKELAKTIEVNIFDFEESIYGETLEIDFASYIREDIKFDSLESLKEQIHIDKKMVIDYFKKHSY